MLKAIFLTVSISAFASSAMADRIKSGGYVGCVTEEALDEFMSAAVKKDERHMNALLGETCVPISGFEYSMVDAGFMTSEIRVYFGNDSVNLFTVAEAAR